MIVRRAMNTPYKPKMPDSDVELDSPYSPDTMNIQSMAEPQ